MYTKYIYWTKTVNALPEFFIYHWRDPFDPRVLLPEHFPAWMKVKGEYEVCVQVATTGTFHSKMGPSSVQGLAKFETGSPIATSSVVPPEARETIRGMTPSVDIREPEYARTGEWKRRYGQWSKDLSVAISGFEISALLADAVLFLYGPYRLDKGGIHTVQDTKLGFLSRWPPFCAEYIKFAAEFARKKTMWDNWIIRPEMEAGNYSYCWYVLLNPGGA